MSDTVNVLVRQAPAEGQTEGDWLAASASAKKKATKVLQTHKNKLVKQEEARKRDEAEGEARRAAELKRLEEAKAIVLEEPKEDATKIKIRQAVEHRGKRVRVFAWVHRLRQQGGMTFVVLRDGTGYLQCVLSGRLVRQISLSQTPFCSLLLMLSSSSVAGIATLTVADLRRPHSDPRVDHPDHWCHQPAPGRQDRPGQPRADCRLVRRRRQGSRR